MSSDTIYRETIEYLYGLQKHGVKLALANSVHLMELMGNPYRRFRSAHIAGTNGKGSTAAFLASMLREAGLRVGLYTSPHLISFTERIRIDNVPIAEAKVVELARRVRDGYRNREAPDGAGPFNPTFFEVTTAAAFTYFAEEGVDIAVIETGMGGRLDSTNVLTPLVSVITNIDLEHAEFLGNTLELIAGEKAGIIKQGVPVVTGVVQPEVLAVIENQAAANRAPVYRLGRDFSPENIERGRTQRFDYRGTDTTYPGVRIGMLGSHQIDNACLALAALECLARSGVVAPEPAVRRGLAGTAWEGRLERVSERPDLFLDGAHNPASAERLAETLREMAPEYRKLILVVGVLADKDVEGVLSPLVSLADRVIATQPAYARALDAAELARRMRARHGCVEITNTVPEAVEKAKHASSSDDLIVITGSLYVVGDARALFATDAGQSPAITGLKG